MHDGIRRGFVLVALAVVFSGLMVHYGAVAPQHELVQQSVTKLESADEHVGESVHVWARVQRNDESLVVYDIGDSNLTVSVVGAETAAQPGDAIQIYGTVRADGAVAADRVVVSEQSGLLRLYAVSIGALVLTVVVFFRSWTVDLQRLTFVPREHGDDA